MKAGIYSIYVSYLKIRRNGENLLRNEKMSEQDTACEYTNELDGLSYGKIGTYKYELLVDVELCFGSIVSIGTKLVQMIVPAMRIYLKSTQPQNHYLIS